MDYPLFICSCISYAGHTMSDNARNTLLVLICMNDADSGNSRHSLGIGVYIEIPCVKYTAPEFQFMRVSSEIRRFRFREIFCATADKIVLSKLLF